MEITAVGTMMVGNEVAVGSCRGCGFPLLNDVVCDLGAMPLANALLSYDDLRRPEVRYPMRAVVCRECTLVQLADVPAPDEIFTDSYPFYAGTSATWRKHCFRLVAEATSRLGLSRSSRVLEIGSNDGELLAEFAARRVTALGIEPCREVAEHALRRGCATHVRFWTSALADEMVADGYRADLVVATNVLAHVPHLGDFLAGVREVLADDGSALFEVPWVGNMIAELQYDQVYAEHHCYFSLRALRTALKRAGLVLVDAELVPVHGGSLRAWARPATSSASVDRSRVRRILDLEKEQGLRNVATYRRFSARLAKAKAKAVATVAGHVLSGERVVGYGASAKATVTLNYLGLGSETIGFVADATPAKQGKYLPGVRVPVVHPDALAEARPDVVVNFVWNFRRESESNIRQAAPKARIVYLSAGS